MRKYQTRNRDSLIEQRNRDSLTYLLKTDLTLEQKRELIAEKNPLLYLFGTVLNPANYLIKENDHEISK